MLTVHPSLRQLCRTKRIESPKATDTFRLLRLCVLRFFFLHTASCAVRCGSQHDDDECCWFCSTRHSRCNSGDKSLKMLFTFLVSLSRNSMTICCGHPATGQNKNDKLRFIHEKHIFLSLSSLSISVQFSFT